MSFEHIDRQCLDTLEASGIIDAYEYVIRKLLNDENPRNQVYEKSARYLLEYQKLVLENNIRAKNAQAFFKLSNIEEEKKKEIKAKEIIPSFPITLRSRLLFEQEENRPPQKIFETNIDELMKNKLNLLSKNELNEQMRSNIKGYGSYAAFVENENEKLRMYDFKIKTKFTNFQFTPMEEIEKGNYPSENKINNLNDNDNNNVNLNSDAEFIIPVGEQRINTQPSRKSTNKSKKSESKKSESKKSESKKSESKKNENKKSESESVSSKSITSSQAGKIKKISNDFVNDLMKK